MIYKTLHRKVNSLKLSVNSCAPGG